MKGYLLEMVRWHFGDNFKATKRKPQNVIV